MSLVHEALRKAEREKQRKAGTVPPAATHQPAPPPPTPTHTPVVHAPAAASPFGSLSRGAQPPGPAPERARETNHSLLPALIGCVAIVAIIAIVFLVSNASSLLRQTKENIPATAAAAATTVPIAQSTTPTDPAAPPTTSSATQPTADSVSTPSASSSTPPTLDDSKYKISGIMNDPDGKPVAVINGHVAYEGYYVDGAIVEKIEADRVILDIKGQKGVLRLH